MLAQSEGAKEKLSLDIDSIMKNEMHQTIATYLGRYAHTIEQKLGLTIDDLLNDIREQIWKGLITHNPKGAANIKTYLNTLIKNRFGVLFKKSKIQKNNMVYYYDSIGDGSAFESEQFTEETGETVFLERELFTRNLSLLSESDQLIYEDLRLGKSLEEMCRLHKLPRPQVIASVFRIAELIEDQNEIDEDV